MQFRRADAAVEGGLGEVAIAKFSDVHSWERAPQKLTQECYYILELIPPNVIGAPLIGIPAALSA
jgi:hypothetical protein